MPQYLVTWAIDVEAGDPVEAAKLAFGHMQRPGTSATVFLVRDKADSGDGTLVDLDEIAEAKQQMADLEEDYPPEDPNTSALKGFMRF